MIYKLTTDRYVLGGDIRRLAIREALNRELDDAVTPRPCPDCGVVQTFSEHDRARLREAVEARITEEWVKAQQQKLAA